MPPMQDGVPLQLPCFIWPKRPLSTLTDRLVQGACFFARSGGRNNVSGSDRFLVVWGVEKVFGFRPEPSVAWGGPFCSLLLWSSLRTVANSSTIRYGCPNPEPLSISSKR